MKAWAQGWLRVALGIVAVTAGLPDAGLARQTLRGHVPAAVTGLRPVERLAATNRLHLAIGLPLRNKAALTQLLEQLYDPASRNYRQYVTPAQFAERFGPTEQDYRALIAFAQTNGLAVAATHPNRVLLDVQGTVPDIERVFHVTLQVYPHPTERRTFYAPDTEPSLDLAVPILGASGLNNYRRPRPNLRLKPLTATAAVTPHAGSGPGGAYRGSDFRAAYVPGVTLTGAGQTLGLLEFDGYFASDISTYLSQAGLASVPLQNVLVGGGSGSAGPDNSEVALDIEMAICMAPGLARILVYEAGPNSLTDDVLNRMATDNLAKQLSSSWTWLDSSAFQDQIFQQFAAQGQSFFNASGDSDAYTGAIDTPADNPYVTVVGGTTLTTTGAGGAWASETVWNDGAGMGSGGGISTVYSLPTWQQDVSMAANRGSSARRNIPDVALVADNAYIVADNGRRYTVGGTSLAAPLWAAFTALVNQQAAANGLSTVGFINPALYALGKGASYAACFHDTTAGNNTSSSSPTRFYAVSGYDLCTGWGTPAGVDLIYALAGTAGGPSAPSRIILATGNLAFGGVKMGSSAQQTLRLYNSGNTALTVTGIAYPAGFSGPWSGTITAGGYQDVIVTFTPAAIQSYGGTVTVSSDATSGLSTLACSGQGLPTGPPGQSTLLSPAGALGASLRPTFSWSAVNQAEWYLLWIQKDGQDYYSQWLQSTTFTPWWDLPGGNYTWWIETWNASGYGPWSAGTSFTLTRSLPGAAVPQTPVGTVTGTEQPSFAWSAGNLATWYYLWINKEGQSYYHQWLQSTAFTPYWDLAAGNYTWWVQTWNANGYGFWSGATSFTLVGSAPGLATPQTPVGLVSATRRPGFVWTAGTEATWYWLWLNKDGQYYYAQWMQSTAFTPWWDLPSGSYTWWVETWNANGSGPWSSAASFTMP